MSAPIFQQRISAWGELPEHGMRRGQLDRYFTRVSAASAVRAIDELLHAVRERGEAAVRLYAALVDVLERAEWLPGLGDDWRRAAMTAGYRHVQYLLMDPPPSRQLGEEEAVLPHPDLSELTLGERKALARVARQDDFDKLLQETHPHVLGILLKHPAIAERHVMRLVVRRPQSPAVPEAVVRAPKWLAFPGVRRAIVFNPYAPTRLGLRLLPLLWQEDWREIIGAEELHPLLREFAAALGVERTQTDLRAASESDVLDEPDGESP